MSDSKRTQPSIGKANSKASTPNSSAKSRTDRRKFLKASGVIAAAAATPGISAANYRRIVGANERIGMAVIGTGGMGTGHIGRFCDLKGESKADYDIIALADVCQPRLDNALNVARTKPSQEGVEVTGYRRYHELLARADVDCVLIATPEHQHHVNAMDAIHAGKVVYLE